MKKLFFSICLATFFASSGLAQIQPGSLVLGLSTGSSGLLTFSEYFSSGANTIGFDVYSSDGEKFTVVTFSPNIGYAFSKNVVAGSGIDLLFAKDEEFKSTSIGLTPFLRGYFPIAGPKTQLLTQINGGYGTTNEDDGFGDGKSTNIQYGVGAGVAMFLSRAVSLDVMLSYNAYNSKFEGDDFDPDDKIGRVGLNLGLTVFLGGGEEK